MTAYFGFAPTEPLKQNIQTLLANLASKTSDPQYHLADKISIEMTDEIIDNLLLNLVKSMQHSEGSGFLNFLGGFLKKAMHGLLKMMLGKTSNEQVAKRAEFLRARFLNLPNDITRIGFVMPDSLYQDFMKHFAAIEAGQGKSHVAGMVKAMQDFADLSMIHFFDDFIEKMDLGLIMRKGAHAVRAGIAKENHSTIAKLIPSLGEEELKHFANYFRNMLVER